MRKLKPVRRPAQAAAALLLIAAAWVRLAGINFQLWLDEIWSIRLAQKCRTPLGVFFLHHDNNHWLNTLVLYFLGPGRPYWTYHVLPELCGIGTVGVGWLLARKRGVWPGFFALILLGASEFLVEYSSEARGYAPAGFFALLCWYLLERHLARPRRLTATMMSAAAVLGLLSHLTFTPVLAGLAAAAVLALHRRRKSWPAAIGRAALWWAVPIAVIVILYLVDVRYMVRGGGPPTPADLPSEAAAMILGMPLGSPAAPVFGALVMILCGLQIWRLFRAADPAWPLCLAGFLFVPAILYLWPRTQYIHPRYVYSVTPMLLTLLGMELGGWMSAAPWRRTAAAAAVTAFVLCNAFPIITFLSLGRGDYLNALRFMLNQTRFEQVIVGADRHPDSTLMVLQYYDWYAVHSAHTLATLRGADWNGQWPQWLIAEGDLGLRVVNTEGAPFVRQASFPNGAVASGITWTIYEAASGQAQVQAQDLKELSRR